MLTELFLAGKYLRPRRNAVSLITLTSILGVTLGVAVLMVVLAVMTGFTSLMKNKLVETQAHFQIQHPVYAIGDPDPVVRAVEKAGGAAAAVIQGPVLVQYRGDRLDTRAMVFGAEPSALEKHLKLEDFMKGGKIDFHARGAVISRSMSERWGVRIGDRILLHSAHRLTSLVRFKPGGGVEMNPDASAYLPAEFTVRGIYSLGKYDFDRMVLFIGPDDAADLFGLRWGSASSVFCWGPDPFDQKELVGKVRAALPGYRVTTWEESNRNLLGVLAVEKRMMFFLLIFIVLVAAFSIANTLITSVYQKTREIGLLKAIGAADGEISLIFVMQGFLIGLVGSLSGTVLGALVITFRNEILSLASKWHGAELFPKEFYYFNELPAQIVPGDVLFIVGASIVLCTLGALLPALRAARLDPARALRYE